MSERDSRVTSVHVQSVQKALRLPLAFLHTFESAGRLGSFALAAQELDLSPSAVSHSIRKLEEWVAMKLFERGTREVKLTREGAVLLEHMQRGINEMRRGLSGLRAVERAPLRLHTSPSFATQWLLPRLAGFIREHPQIDLRISASTDYARFDGDDFDIDIVYGIPRTSPHEKIPIALEKLTPLCAPALATQIRSPSDLYQQRLIQCDVQMFQWKGWFEANRLVAPSHHALRFDRSAMAIAAAVDGLGVVLESDLLAERELRSGHLVRPLLGKTQDLQYIGHHLVYPKRLHQHESFETFMRWLLAEVERVRRTPDGSSPSLA